MYIEVGVKVLLKNRDGKYLLVRRNPKKYPEIGPTWDIVGGRIHAGVPLIENLHREVYEEVGLTIEGEPTLVAAQDILGVSRFPDRHVVRLTYIATANGMPTIDSESIDCMWVTADEIRAMPAIELDRFLKELIDTKRVAL